MRRAAGTLLAISLLVLPGGAWAQPARPAAILIQGEINRDTLTQFQEALREAPRARIILDSPGGSVLPALEIGRIIRERRLSTFIPDRTLCASACGLIWLAGAPRELAPLALVGFHAAATVSESGRRSISAPANAIIGGYLRDLGFGDEAIFEMTRAAPRGMNWFNTVRLTALGVSHGPGSPPASPAARPAPTPTRTTPTQATPTQATPTQPAPSQAAPSQAAPNQAGRVLEGLWVGEYRCGREARTARMMIWNDAGRPGASFEYGPTDASPHLEHGLVQWRGTAQPDGRVRFQPESRPPPGEGPPGLLAWLEGGQLKAEVMNRRCEVLSLRKARS